MRQIHYMTRLHNGIVGLNGMLNNNDVKTIRGVFYTILPRNKARRKVRNRIAKLSRRRNRQ